MGVLRRACCCRPEHFINVAYSGPLAGAGAGVSWSVHGIATSREGGVSLSIIGIGGISSGGALGMG